MILDSRVLSSILAHVYDVTLLWIQAVSHSLNTFDNEYNLTEKPRIKAHSVYLYIFSLCLMFNIHTPFVENIQTQTENESPGKSNKCEYIYYDVNSKFKKRE